MCEIVISVMPDGSMYTTEHEMSLQMEGLTKPRRKRGRPPKVHTDADSMVCNKLLQLFIVFYVITNMICTIIRYVYFIRQQKRILEKL